MNEASSAVELQDVEKRFGEFTAVHSTSLKIPDGQFVTLVGPSGCGKTTTLRMIAGLTSVTGGDILIKGNRVNDVPIHKRNLGLVFQNYALFPHKNVFDNVAFGLKYRKVSRDQYADRVNEALRLVQLPDAGNRFPKQLSGGQQQRIALARAIVIQPDVLLLDEPLSALDANLREDMRVELKRIQHQLGVTTVFVTHDQSEALAMSDTIVVMSNGHVEQVGTPEEVYNRPASEFVAAFLGNSNILEGKVTSADGELGKVEVQGLGTLLATLEDPQGTKEGDRVKVSIRAEKVFLDQESGEDNSVTLDATINTLDYQGQLARYFLRAGEHTLQAINTIDVRPISEGTAVKAQIRARDCVVLPPDRTQA